MRAWWMMALAAGCAGRRAADDGPQVQVQATTVAPHASGATQRTVTHTTGSRAAPSLGFGERATRWALGFHDGLVDPGRNGVTSGASAGFVFGMLAEGGVGATRAAWETVLGAPLATLHVDHARAMAAYADTPGVTLRSASAVWPDADLAVGQAWSATLDQAYGVQPEPLPLTADPTAAAARMDAWTAENTDGLIPTLFSADQLAGARVVLADALVFRGSWEQAFDPAQTAPATFQAPSGPVQAPMMRRDDAQVGYVEAEGYRAVSLPYEDGGAMMFVLLPEAGAELAQLPTALTGDALLAMAMAPRRPVRLALPRFRVSSEHDLLARAPALGLDRLLGDGADYSEIAPGLVVSAAIQKVTVEVDEQGAAAAAATGVAMKRSVVLPVDFVADRPFLFVLWHAETRSPLFVGQVVDPS